MSSSVDISNVTEVLIDERMTLMTQLFIYQDLINIDSSSAVSHTVNGLQNGNILKFCGGFAAKSVLQNLLQIRVLCKIRLEMNVKEKTYLW